MKPEDFTAEQKAKLKSCKNMDELMSALGTMGIELSDEQLEAASGGGGVGWQSCETETCNCNMEFLKSK